MNKKILICLIGAFLLVPFNANSSEKLLTKNSATIAILDTALDTSVPEFENRIVHEVCILSWASCPNNDFFMEGPGSARLPKGIITKNGFDHGTKMVSAFVKNNLNTNIVFIRIIAHSSDGSRLNSGEIAINAALDWIYENKERFNIQAVSMSQSSHNLSKSINYCPESYDMSEKIKNLSIAEIPVFFPAGNLKDYKRISWPACIEESISVGSSNKYNKIALWSNIDTVKTDFYALGEMNLTGPNNKISYSSGTSVSTQVAAAQWMTIKNYKPELSYQDIYNLILRTSNYIVGPNWTTGKLINVQGAINE